MNDKAKTDIRVAHISGRYLIAATIIGGLFGLSIGISFIVVLRPQPPPVPATQPSTPSEVKYVHLYNHVYTLPLNPASTESNQSSQIAREHPDQPGYPRPGQQASRSFYGAWRFREKDVSVEVNATLNRVRGTTLVTVSLVGPGPIEHEQQMRTGDVCELDDRLRFQLRRVWLDMEGVCFLRARLYEVKETPPANSHGPQADEKTESSASQGARRSRRRGP